MSKGKTKKPEYGIYFELNYNLNGKRKTAYYTDSTAASEDFYEIYFPQGKCNLILKGAGFEMTVYAN